MEDFNIPLWIFFLLDIKNKDNYNESKENKCIGGDNVTYNNLPESQFENLKDEQILDYIKKGNNISNDFIEVRINNTFAFANKSDLNERRK